MPSDPRENPTGREPEDHTHRTDVEHQLFQKSTGFRKGTGFHAGNQLDTRHALMSSDLEFSTILSQEAARS